MQDTAGEVRVNSLAMYSHGPLHMDKQENGKQVEPIYNGSLLIKDVARKTYQERWTIGTNGGRGSGKSVQVTRHDADADI